MTHISVNKKTDFLFKKVVGYSRTINEDKEFLLFLGKFRNTMHTNFIYYGNDYNFKFGNAYFQFENGKMVKWYDPFNDNFVASPKLYFALMSELKKIWKALILSIPHKNIIQYPDNAQE
ncbi:MAG: hypothetical protein B7Y83_16980 [Flavobacteriales bacterium 32-34-25]|nr:MAG: hypothetical protein B7Y83_16980 [Flavobacteriales bacterium 32-34-25]